MSSIANPWSEVLPMSVSHVETSASWHERRKYPRYFVGAGLTLAIDDEVCRNLLAWANRMTSVWEV